jgi:uncharacterized repeat protein (TIGR01451 family)
MTAIRRHRRGRGTVRAVRGVTCAIGVALGALLLPPRLTAQTADLSITKIGPSQVQGGGVGIITYLLVTTNNGPSTATNVIVRDTLPLPSQFTFISASRGASRAARRLTWPATTLTSGQTVVDTVVIQVNAGTGTLLTNTAVVSGSPTDSNTADNLSRVQTLVVDATVIGVAVTPDGADTVPRLPSNGVSYGYALTVTNTGAVATDHDLLVRVAGPSFLTVDSITGTGVTQGGVPDSARLTGLAVGAAASVSVWHRVGGVATGSLDSLTLRARSVPVPSVSDSGWSYVRVVRPAILTAKSVAPAGVSPPGTELTYSVVVTNGGSEQAAGVMVVDSLPAEVEFKVGSAAEVLPGGVTAVVQYSIDAADWSYAPTSTGCSADAGYDRCVRYVRWTLQQPLAAAPPANSATFALVARIR